jgi:hypothetical protein
MIVLSTTIIQGGKLHFCIANIWLHAEGDGASKKYKIEGSQILCFVEIIN